MKPLSQNQLTVFEATVLELDVLADEIKRLELVIAAARQRLVANRARAQQLMSTTLRYNGVDNTEVLVRAAHDPGKPA